MPPPQPHWPSERQVQLQLWQSKGSRQSMQSLKQVIIWYLWPYRNSRCLWPGGTQAPSWTEASLEIVNRGTHLMLKSSSRGSSSPYNGAMRSQWWEQLRPITIITMMFTFAIYSIIIICSINILPVIIWLYHLQCSSHLCDNGTLTILAEYLFW